MLARPFFNVNEGHEDRELTASPGIAPGDVLKSVGTIRVDTSSTFLGAEANLRTLCWCSDNFILTGLVGFRYLYLSENLTINENLTILKDIPTAPPNVPLFAGDQVTVFDSFSTKNHFYGGQVGTTAQWQRGRWSLMTTGKIAIGATVQSVDIDGGQEIVSKNGNRQAFTGGLLAVSSNIGHHTQTRMAFVPEVGLKVGYNLSQNVRVFVGYDFLYWSNVLRPGDQIDRNLDLNLVPNSGAPSPGGPGPPDRAVPDLELLGAGRERGRHVPLLMNLFNCNVLRHPESMKTWRCVAPSPLAGEGWGGGLDAPLITPTPTLPVEGEGDF